MKRIPNGHLLPTLRNPQFDGRKIEPGIVGNHIRKKLVTLQGQIYEKATESVSPRMQSAPKPQNTAQSGSERTGSQTKSADRILLLN